MKKTAGLVLLTLALAGCSAQSPSASSTGSATPAAAAAQTATPTPTPTPTPTAAETAAVIAKRIKSAVKSATGVTEVTEANDSNHLLGRPGQYTSAAWIADSGATAGETGVDGGAVVEVFATPADATTRATYIEGVLKKLGPAAGTEYHYVKGATLLRVSGKLPPSAAEVYHSAL